MLNFKKINNLHFVHVTNDSGKITASATYEVFNKGLFNEFLNELINNEILDIREFDGADNLTNEEILTEFSENFEELFCLKNSVSEDDFVIHLKFIENKGIEKGAAKEIVDYLKSNYNKIILYSLEEAVKYWTNSGFKTVFRDEYYGFNFN